MSEKNVPAYRKTIRYSEEKEYPESSLVYVEIERTWNLPVTEDAEFAARQGFQLIESHMMTEQAGIGIKLKGLARKPKWLRWLI